MANRKKLTAADKQIFLEHLRQTANVSESARVTGVNRRIVYVYRKEDEDFAADWEDAVDEAVDALKAEARRRALEGIEEPLTYQGEVFHHVRRYSDTLMMFLIKAHDPTYRESYRHEVTGQDGGPIPIRFIEVSDGDD